MDHSQSTLQFRAPNPALVEPPHEAPRRPHSCRPPLAVEERRSLVERARDVIAGGAITGNATTDTVAERMGLSRRTLQRYLQQQGTSVLALAASTRRDLAMQALAASSLPANRIGELLGFTCDTSFYRAFKRWTGMTPLQYRKQQKAARGAEVSA